MPKYTEPMALAMGFIACYGPATDREIAAEILAESPSRRASALLDARQALLRLLALDLICPYNAPFESAELADDEEPAFDQKDPDAFAAAHAEAVRQMRETNWR